MSENKLYLLKMKDCPFCGHAVDLEDGDTLYPNGIGWKDYPDIGIRGYFNHKEVPKEQLCWSIHCPTTAGGCGVEISADSRQEAIDKWNTRV